MKTIEDYYDGPDPALENDGLDECYYCGKTVPSSYGGCCGCQD